MTLKKNLSILILVPILGLTVVFIMGISSFGELQRGLPALNTVQEDRATILNGDRDAYQAFLAEKTALASSNGPVLSQAELDMEENLQQTWERITDPSGGFTREMTDLLIPFQEYYDTWAALSREIMQNSHSIAENSARKSELILLSASSFQKMRGIIDGMTDRAESRIDQGGSASRLKALNVAAQLILNADRDAYQAYTAQLEAETAETEEQLISLLDSQKENLDQVRDRLQGATALTESVLGDLTAGFTDAYDSWRDQTLSITSLIQDDFETLRQMKETAVASEQNFQEMRNIIDQLGNMQQERALALTEEMVGKIQVLMRSYAIIVAITILAAILASILITRYILSQLGRDPAIIARIAEEVADGRLIPEEQDEQEVGVFASVSRMRSNLIQIIEEINLSARDVDQGSQQMTISAQQLSQGASQQAASIEEVSSSLQQIGSNITQCAGNAKETGRIAMKTVSEIESGEEAVYQTVEAMKNISEKIEIIEEIARSTNMLALNASVEAARAGEHGNGFAVVAQEVRKLAERSQKAAGEISELTRASVVKAEKAGAMFNSIVPDIKKTAEMVEEINLATVEQMQGTEQVFKAVTQLDQVIQMNASSSEEMASVSEELSGQAGALKQMISYFQIKERDAQVKLHAPLNLSPDA